jgi:hypothetical protein
MAFHIEFDRNPASSLSCNMKDTTTRICVLCVQRARQSRHAALVWERSHLLALFCQAAITKIAVRRCLVGHNAGTPKTYICYVAMKYKSRALSARGGRKYV